MIRRTLTDTQQATYSLDLPRASANGATSPTGTGFFISPEGWFVTAAHVVTENGLPDGKPRSDIGDAWLMKERGDDGFIKGMCQFPRLDTVIPEVDFALLKLEFDANAGKSNLVGRSGFPHVMVSTRLLEEGEPVYAFGYPLSGFEVLPSGPGITMTHSSHCPRTTSAIVAATMDTTGMVWSPSDPQVYVLDKALNYGNSGGPIVATDTGRVHALCSRFQPLQIQQRHLKDASGNHLTIKIPSLYGVVSRLSNPTILQCLADRGIPLADD